ncbi:uncharacterized protein KD926_005915 [Aspergillus affinis]|uniref:uncharacterized protein n=1 Tax=Aspergillus affinis TaxID=1070780 RepID=UPI0022FF4139|nr:uncharacterized protein KD926_005915 [Aspergillus affinis]KAI9045971.1 hypothetical protein KD926_005915 [Aspergillus affinis]
MSVWDKFRARVLKPQLQERENRKNRLDQHDNRPINPTGSPVNERTLPPIASSPSTLTPVHIAAEGNMEVEDYGEGPSQWPSQSDTESSFSSFGPNADSESEQSEEKSDQDQHSSQQSSGDELPFNTDQDGVDMEED